VGESGLGKTTFINTLFATSINEYANPHKRRDRQLSKTVDVSLVRASLEEKGFKLNLTVIDTPGFGDYVDNTTAADPIIEFVDQQQDAYMHHELSDGRIEDAFVDLRVHCCLYFIQPTGHTYFPLSFLTRGIYI
jgi:cell division control protein 12